MEHQLPDLPYPKNALAPHISEETLEFHYGKHHAGYVTKLNNGVKGTEFEDVPLEDIIRNAKGGVFNNAAQVWNHTFYWNCMSPNGGGGPKGAIKEAIDKKWGSFDKFKEEFTKSALGNFGSGWTWLIKNASGEPEILNTDDADTPLAHGQKALMTLDIWEHAYYIDYRNARPKYVEAFWNLVNWDFVNQNLES
mgnify:CR=1 FL=1